MRRIINKFKNFISLIPNVLMNVIKRLIYLKADWLKLVNSISYKKISIFYFLLFCFGRILLQQNPIRYDMIHQIILTIISFMVIFSLKYAYFMTEKLKDASSGLIYTTRNNNHTSKTLQMIINQMINLQQSMWWLILTLFPVIEFIRKNIYLGFVEKNFAGYYAILFAASTYYLALLGYSQIIIALIQFYKISNDDGECIPLDFPNDVISPPEWLVLWNQLFEKIIKVFFCVGTLFTFEYVLLMPRNVVEIKNGKYTFNVCDARSFLTSWLIILIFIIIAFPIISSIIKSMQKLLENNLSKKINREYKILFSNNKNRSGLDIWAYKQLIATSGNSYIHTKKSYIPIASTSLAFLLNIIKFYESILLPLLNI